MYIQAAAGIWGHMFYINTVFLLAFIAFSFQKLIMTDTMQTNEMKRHPVIMAFKADHGDLETACFLRVPKSFVHKIRKELEK